MASGSNWYQFRNKTCYIPKVSKLSAEKGNIRQQAEKWYLQHVNLHFTKQKIMQREDSMELNFEVLETQKWNIQTNRAEE